MNYTINNINLTDEVAFSSSENIPANDKIIQIWFVLSGGLVFIRNLKKEINSFIDIKDITVEALSEPHAIYEVKVEWNIDCQEDDLIKLYEINVNLNKKLLTKIEGYLLENIKIDQEGIELLHKTYDGYFADYHNLDDMFANYNKDNIFKECFYTFLAKLYERYNMTDMK